MSSEVSAGRRRRHSRQRGTRSRWIAAGAFFALVAVSVWLLTASLRSHDYSTGDAYSLPSSQPWGGPELDENAVLQAFSGSERRIYPYSIIPGGIQNADDLRRVVEHDSVVASHFADFNFHRARVVELAEPKLFYLSYRIGNKIFWTSKQASLRKGEKVITDGNIMARLRCANQLSELPHLVTSPAEPTIAQLDEMIPPLAVANYMPGVVESPPPPPPPTEAYNPPITGGILPPTGTSPSCTPIKTKGKPEEEIKAQTQQTKPLPPCPPGPPGPPSIPEPGTIFLVSSGVASIYLRLRRSGKR